MAPNLLQLNANEYGFQNRNHVALQCYLAGKRSRKGRSVRNRSGCFHGAIENENLQSIAIEIGSKLQKVINTL